MKMKLANKKGKKRRKAQQKKNTKNSISNKSGGNKYKENLWYDKKRYKFRNRKNETSR